MAIQPQLPRLGKEEIAPDHDLIEIYDRSSGLMKLTTPSALGGGGAGLQLKDGATLTSSLQIVADADNTSSALRISTTSVSNYGNSGNLTNTAFGYDALISNGTATNQVAIGANALKTHSTAWGSNVAVGSNALRNATDEGNVAIGYNAGLNYTDYNSVFIGWEAKAAAQYGTYTVGIGWQAAYNNKMGEFVAIGSGSMGALPTGSYGDGCVAIGSWSMQSGQVNYSTAVGYSAMQNHGGTDNVAMGYNAMYGFGTGSQNIAIGTNALTNPTTANSNTMVGHAAGRWTQTGHSNVFIGREAGPVSGGAPAAYSATICIGRQAYATANNQMVIGSTAYPAGTVTNAAATQTHYWTVRINGTDYKILLGS